MSFTQDLRYAVRGLVRRPALAAVTTFALTVGIAANAIMFGVVDQLLLRPPAGVRAPETLRRVYYRSMEEGKPSTGSVTTYRTILALRANVPGFSGVAGFFHTPFTMGRGADARSVDVDMVSGNWFDLLGVRPELGRTFAAGEDVPPRGAAVAVVSDGFWRSQLGGGANVLGRRVELNGRQYTIIGVAPADFGNMDRQKVDLWIPISAAAADQVGEDWYRLPFSYWVQAVAKLRPNVDPRLVERQASEAYRREVASWDRRAWQPKEVSAVLGPLAAGRTPDGVSAEGKVSLWLMGVSTIVLLIACANVANLLIARTVDRRREIAVRLALGAGRGRLLRQLLTEAALLAALATVAALIVAHWGGQLVQRVLLPGIVWSGDVLDARVLAFTIAVAVACILLCGLAPALQGIRENVADGLKAASRQVAGSRGVLRATLLVMQAALSVLLLVGAGLFVKSLRHVVGRDVGITLDRVMLVTMDLSHAGFAPPDIKQMFERGAERLRAIPGVQQAAVVASTLPLRTARGMSITLRGKPKDWRPRLSGGGPYDAEVDDDFFGAAGTRIIAGRTFTPAEERSPSRVVIVNKMLADAYWPGRSPVGECVLVGSDSTCSTVVGVVENVMLFAIVNDDRAMLYVPPSHPEFGDSPPAGMLVRTKGDPAALAPLVRAELQRLSPNMPYVEAEPLMDLLAPQLRPWRLGATMFTLFGAIALLIAAVGLYSVMAYWVSQRGHEIGVRMALGAQRGDIVRLVATQASRPIAVGLVLGAGAAALASRWVADMLYDTSPRDPVVYGTAAVVLAVAAIVACVVPARRSAAIEPASALRAD